MSSTTFSETQPVPEASCRLYSAQLVGIDGLPLSSAQVTSIRFSLHDAKSNVVVNDRQRVEVMNANGGTLSPTALFTMEFNERDTVSIGSSKLQKRRALFTVYYDNCTENHEVFFFVQNLYDVPNTPGQPWAEDAIRLSDAVTAVLV